MTSLVTGILALIFAFVPVINVVTFPLAVIALVFGGIAMGKHHPGFGMAIAGIATALASFIVVILMLASFANSG